MDGEGTEDISAPAPTADTGRRRRS
jgi:hypothetical protein